MRNFFRLLFGLSIVVAVIVMIALTLESYITSEEITINITKIEKYQTEDGENYYIMNTEQGIFENRNSSFQRKNNADTIAKLLKKNGEYKVRAIGYNFGLKLPFFVRHRNIIEVISGPGIIKGKIKKD